MTTIHSGGRPVNQRFSSGFTLVEAIVAIVITGILAGMVSLFIAGPVGGYVESSRRADLTDAADLVLRRMAREVRLALPNSIRISQPGGAGTTFFLEFIPTVGGGSYRDAQDGSTSGLALNFSDPTVCVGGGAVPANCQFDIIGTPPSEPSIAVGDYIVVLNFGEVSGISQAPNNAYADGDICENCNRAKVLGTAVAGGVTTITLTPSSAAAVSPPTNPNANVFTTTGVGRSDSDSTNRFHVVASTGRGVMYECPGAAPGGDLKRYENYGFKTSIANAITAAQATTATILAKNVYCNMSYAANTSQQHTGLLSVRLTVKRSSETGDTEQIDMLRQIHMDNSP